MKINSFSHRGASFLTFAFAIATVCSSTSRAQSKGPRFEVDPNWPKPLPNLWVTGGIGGVCIDSRDHVFILNRRDLTDNDLDAGHQAPVVIEFDPDGNVVNSFGAPDSTPDTPHGCAVDADGNVWMTGNGDGIVQKYSHDGSKLLLQIGKKGVADSSDGTSKGKPLNASHEGFFKPAGVAIDSKSGDVYVADGETPGGNHRVAVFDREGKFLRQWDLHRTEAETGPEFIPVLHCVTLDGNGLVYVCDRRGHRIQVFDKMGNFQKNIAVEYEHRSPLPSGPGHESGALGSAVAVAFSHDTGQKYTYVSNQDNERIDTLDQTTGQKYMYVANQDNEQIDILDRATGQLLSSFGRVGRQPGEFTYIHFLAVDSKGNIYVAEVGTGKRIQKFKLVGGN